MFLIYEFFSQDDLKRLRDSYPEWILLGIAVMSLAVVVIDPFKAFWQ